MSTLPLIADRSTMSGGDLIVALAFIAVIAGALHLALWLGGRQ